MDTFFHVAYSFHKCQNRKMSNIRTRNIRDAFLNILFFPRSQNVEFLLKKMQTIENTEYLLDKDFY